jgi:hypothetical protein
MRFHSAICILAQTVWAIAAAGDFSVPVVPAGGSDEDLADGRVQIDWNAAASVKTVTFMLPLTTTRIFPRLTSAADVVRESAAFIDAHPEFFAASSSDFAALTAHPGLGGRVWRAVGQQFHQGVALLGTFLSLKVDNDGNLLSLEARLFPPVDLENFDTQPRLNRKDAWTIAVAAHGEEASVRSTELWIGFISRAPALLWQVELGPPGAWRYTIAAQTGRVEGVQDLASNTVTAGFIRGDANADQTVDMADPISTLNYLFSGRPARLACPDAADINDDGELNVSDAIHGLQYLFVGGPAPPKPFPHSGRDPTSDDLTCSIGG